MNIQKLINDGKVLLVASVAGILSLIPMKLFGLTSAVSVPITLATLSVSVYLVLEQKRKKKKNAIRIDALKSTDDFLNSFDVNSGSEEFILFLRPFGNDGYSRPSKLDLKNNSDLYNMRYSVNISEEVICKEIQSNFNVKVIALADQHLEMVPEFPSYYRCDNQNWKLHVELLLKRCLFVVIFLPCDTSIRNSLRWEIFTALCVGLRSRMLLIYPGSWNGPQNLVVSDLKSHLEYIDLVSDLSDRSVGFILKNGDVSKQYILIDEAVQKESYADPVANISPFLSDMMSAMKKNINDIPYKNLYAFKNSDVLNYDLDLTNFQMKCIFEDKEGMFDTLRL